MAVPGSPLDPRSRGCNHLIREGATLIRDIGDIMECLARPMGAGVPPAQDWKTGRLAPGTPEAIDQCRDAILSGLGPETTDIDEVIAWCDAPTATVLAALLELELAGRVTASRQSNLPCHGQVNATGPSAGGALTNVEGYYLRSQTRGIAHETRHRQITPPKPKPSIVILVTITRFWRHMGMSAICRAKTVRCFRTRTSP